jgi:hypothetical protein
MKYLLAACMVCALVSPVALARVYTLQQGVALNGALQQSIDSKSTTVGTPFTMVLSPPFPNGLLRGATVYGHVASVQKAGQGTLPHIGLAFDRIVFHDGTFQPIHAQLLKDTPVQDKSGKETKAVARAVGGIIGPAHGLGVALLSKNHKDDVTIPQNSTLVIELTKPLRL